MKVKLLGIYGLDIAMKAMRNPMKSWDKANSESDEALLKALMAGGDEESKILRFPEIYMELTLPRYLWSEVDTYKVGFDMMSESTMHRLMIDGVNPKDFEYEPEDEDFILMACKKINGLVARFKKETNPKKKEKLRERAKSLLPECFLQMRTIKMSLQTARRIWKQRHNHRLPLWRKICEFLANLPEVGWIITYEPPKKITGFKVYENTKQVFDEFFVNQDGELMMYGPSVTFGEPDGLVYAPEEYEVRFL